MTVKQNNLLGRIFKNKDGRVIIWQNPNIPLWGWIGFSVFGFVFRHGNLHGGFQHLAGASLFTWVYLEIRTGESIFRRVLGMIVLACLIYGFFKVK